MAQLMRGILREGMRAAALDPEAHFLARAGVGGLVTALGLQGLAMYNDHAQLESTKDELGADLPAIVWQNEEYADALREFKPPRGSGDRLVTAYRMVGQTLAALEEFGLSILAAPTDDIVNLNVPDACIVLDELFETVLDAWGVFLLRIEHHDVVAPQYDQTPEEVAAMVPPLSPKERKAYRKFASQPLEKRVELHDKLEAWMHDGAIGNMLPQMVNPELTDLHFELLEAAQRTHEMAKRRLLEEESAVVEALKAAKHDPLEMMRVDLMDLDEGHAGAGLEGAEADELDLLARGPLRDDGFDPEQFGGTQ